MNKSVLEMPKGYVAITDEEMLVIDGGYAIPVNRSLATKAGAMAAANKLYNEGKISKGNVKLIAKEIRGHAVAYYGLDGLSKLGISNATLKSMKNSANPIDVVDGPDSRKYVVAACELIWMLPG
ncbi:MAG: hypothetical protein E7214_07090 [Clostridium sp.]|nr:hypothetical protein [Clostridium sp.]